jgi:nucleotide-binding universal stress UspA family protein
MEPFRRAVVALANDPSDSGLLAYARTLGSVLGGDAEWSLVHVMPRPSATAAGAAVLSHRAVLDGVEQSAAALAATASSHVLSGSRVDKLLEFAAEGKADCILVGHRGGQPGRRSLARRLAMKAPCSVWMVPEGSPATISNVLAAVDFSEASAHAVSCAALIASRAGVRRIAALHVSVGNRGAAEMAFRRFLAPVDLHGVDVESRIDESGSVSAAVLRIADGEQCDVIVMGARGLGRSSAVLLGSESEDVLAKSRRPVLVTRRRGERLAVLQVLLDRDFQTQESV